MTTLSLRDMCTITTSPLEVVYGRYAGRTRKLLNEVQEIIKSLEQRKDDLDSLETQVRDEASKLGFTVGNQHDYDTQFILNYVSLVS